MSENLKRELLKEDFPKSVEEINTFFLNFKNDEFFQNIIKPENFVDNIFTTICFYNKISYLSRNFELFNRLVDNNITEEETEDFRLIFGKSSQFIELNNNLLAAGKAIQDHFIKNIEEISFSEKTKDIQPYFEKKPNILSFCFSLAMPDQETSEVFSTFKQLYQSEFLRKNIKEDELFSYLAFVYSINEIIKATTFVLQKMLIKKI